MLVLQPERYPSTEMRQLEMFYGEAESSAASEREGEGGAVSTLSDDFRAEQYADG